ncbi:hypothetical protein G9A89_001011 [Geosiphon pyriformis]|nr:hypothetical protein G9A89_001011 [Geosiphon pyriformis]
MEKSSRIEESMSEPTSRFKLNLDQAQSPLSLLTSLNKAQALTFGCAWLGWTLNSFDFAILIYALPHIAEEFDMKPSVIASSITITLLFRPLGGLIFGIAAERWGRKYPLMINIILFSMLELASGFAPNFKVFFVSRALFGIAMGGEWGLGATLTMENLPIETRGYKFFDLVSKGFQGYPIGSLLAAALYYAAINSLGWRAMFWIGSFPALLVVIIRIWVPESEVWLQQRDQQRVNVEKWSQKIKQLIINHWGIFSYGMLLMGSMNFSRGMSALQSTSKTFIQMGFNPRELFLSSLVTCVGAISGAPISGYFSQYLGRRRTIIILVILQTCFIPLIGLAQNSFGYWGIIPAYLSEIAPPSVRNVFVSLTSQTGILFGSYMAQAHSQLAEKFPLSDGRPNYAVVQAISLAIGTVLVVTISAFGKEAKDINFRQNTEEKENLEIKDMKI